MAGCSAHLHLVLSSLHFAPHLVYRLLVPPKPLRAERIQSLQTIHLWGLWFKQPFLFLFLLRCQWMCNWLPPLRPQLCVRQPAGELQMWVPEWLHFCRRPAHLHLWVPTRAPECMTFHCSSTGDLLHGFLGNRQFTWEEPKAMAQFSPVCWGFVFVWVFFVVVVVLCYLSIEIEIFGVSHGRMFTSVRTAV